MAWVEYQESGDGAAFTHVCTSRLRFENAFASLPRSAESTATRVASNAPNSKFAVQTFSQRGTKPRRGVLAIPGAGDDQLFQSWVTSPAISGDRLVSDPRAPTQIDLLAVSGHGGGGDVWGDVSGAEARVSPPYAFLEHEDDIRSGRLKCLLVPACTNLNFDAAPLWLAAFKHPQPLHVILGYEDRYSGGPFGARALGRFAELLAKHRRMPLIEAWRRANESVRPSQPWAALAALAGEGLNLDDWLANNLPPLSNVGQLLHFNGAHPEGREAQLVDPNYEARWVMGGSSHTVIDMNNNQPGNSTVGLFAGKPATIRIRAKTGAAAFEQGQVLYLSIYRYRRTKRFDITRLLALDDSLTRPHPATGVPIAKIEKGRIDRRSPGELELDPDPTFDSIRITVPSDTTTLELPFVVPSSASDDLPADGPGGTHGRYMLDFHYDPVLTDIKGRQMLAFTDDRTYAAADGALLRR